MADKQQVDTPTPTEQARTEAELLSKLPKDAQDRLKKIKEELDQFQKAVVKKFDKYISGIALLPPPKDADPKQKDQIHVLVLVDDSDSQKMSKGELKDKLHSIISKMGTDIDKNIVVQTIILSELWQSCYDGKTDLLQLIAVGAQVYDTGMLAAVKISEVHKTMVLKKFERYIVSYVLSGSLIRGQATKTSDIDVFVVIDDTDVKKMTRTELKDKLRAIIIGMGIEAGEITGTKNKINIQVYILTDFWDSLREANPIIFTLLRDGVPFFDRGIFMPWKQLLKMGKIKPSDEAIDMFMSSGDQMLRRVHFKLKEIGMEDTYYAILTPSQAALMMFGLAPPTPKETAHLMREVFVKKEKLLEEKFVKILEHNIEIRKQLEHGTKAELSGKEVDQLLNDAESYLKRVNRLFTQIEKIKEGESMTAMYDQTMNMVRNVLSSEGVSKVSDKDIVKVFEGEFIQKAKLPDTFVRVLQSVLDAKKDYENQKLTKQEVDRVRKDANGLMRLLVDHLQRKDQQNVEKIKLKVQYGSNKVGEIILLEKTAYVLSDLESDTRKIQRATKKEDGRLVDLALLSPQEFEKELAENTYFKRTLLTEPLFGSLKQIFGSDVKIVL